MVFGPRPLCLLIAVVLLAVAALYVPPQPTRVNLIALGLAFFAISFLVP